MEDWQHGGFGVYIHWPFCAAKCPYCDFNSHVRGAVDHATWRDALLRELDNAAARIGPRKVDAIFFGGGTPSLMHPDTVAALIARVQDHWDASNDLEITLEANPTSVEADKFRAFRDAGVNRISLGVQALNDPDLKALGRMHSAAEARQAFDIARLNFDRVSFDLIYARQNQTLRHWQTELGEALSMAADHLSLYQLTIEPQTRFGDLYARGNLRGLPSDDAAADMYQMTQDLCGAAGLPAYEVSNHARDGAASRHNLIYWRYGDYVGIGPGAHGRITVGGQKIATTSQPMPEAWLDAMSGKNTATKDTEIIAPTDQASEYLMMSLRLSEGSDLARYQSLAGGPINQRAVRDGVADGLLEISGDHLRATDRGRIVLNTLLANLLTTNG